MPSPKGDLTLLCQGVQAASSMLGFARVLSGKNELPKAGAPERVVMFPVGAYNGTADDRTVSVTSAWMLITGHFWARSPDAAFDLRQRFFQALRIQADAGGYFWKSPDGENERWDTDPDTAEQGQEFEIDIVIRVDANLPASYLTKGTVQSTSMARTATLTTGVNASVNVIPVDATFEQITSGVLHIDDEQMSFTGVTPTGFTGVVRGINGTTAAAHASGVAVYVSPT